MFDFIYYEAKVAVLIAVFYICYRLFFHSVSCIFLRRLLWIKLYRELPKPRPPFSFLWIPP